jgi:hypothetical protein
MQHELQRGLHRLMQPFVVEKIDKSTGEIKIRSEFRLSVCNRVLVGDVWSAYRNGDSVGISGVMRCGCVWACPFCCSKVMAIQGIRIAFIFEGVSKLGGYSFLVTFIASHSIGTPLSWQLDAFKNALKFLTESRSYRNLIRFRLGSVSATEITFSDLSGWHPHAHQAMFFPAGIEIDIDKFADDVFECWKIACAKFGLVTAKYFKGRRVGVDVRRAWDASEYLTKFDRQRDWSLSAEMTTGRLKTSNGKSVTPWKILESAIINGRDSSDFKLWLEYLRATKGKSVVSLKSCRKLLIQLGLPTSFDDFKDANKKGEGEILGNFPAESFRQLIKAGGMGQFLEHARKGDFSKFVDF